MNYTTLHYNTQYITLKCVYKCMVTARLQGVLCTVSPWQHSKWTFDPRD